MQRVEPVAVRPSLGRVTSMRPCIYAKFAPAFLETGLGCIGAWVSPEGEVSMWRPIATAPRDGTKIDLLYPHPRGRMINCFWHARTRTWMWRTPRWQGDTLLPEHQWDLHYAPDAQPTHWRLAPVPPQESVHRASLDQPRG